MLITMGLLAIRWSGKTSPGFAMEDSGSVTDACADANGDGAVTVSDGVQVLRAAADLSSSCTLFSCDVDGSGSVGLTDGVNVLERAAGFSLGTAYGCPVPSTSTTSRPSRSSSSPFWVSSLSARRLGRCSTS